jgi:hypothetical protein
MNTTVQNDPSASTRSKWLKLLPWAAGLILVVLVVWGVKIAWEKEEPQLPHLHTASPSPAPKPSPEPYLDITAKVVDDETGKPVEKFALQGGMKKDGKISWGFWMQSPSNYTGGVLTHRFSGKIGEEQVMRIIADGYLPEPVTGIMGQPPIEDMVVRLSRGGTLRGKILDYDGKPAAGATVYLAGAQPVSLRDGKPEYFGGSKTTTDEKGEFRLRGMPKETSTVIIVAQSVRPWPFEVKSLDEPIEVKLPEPGKLRVKYDIEGAAAEGTIHIHIKSWEMPGWKGVDSYDHPKVKNGGEVVLDHLAPGIYDFARSVQAGNHGLFADRTTVVIESGKMAEAGFVRREGAQVSGKITGIDENAKIESATVMVLPPDKAGAERSIFGPIVDAVGLVDGKFKTPKLLPGDYVVNVDVYMPEPPNQLGRLGMRMPDYSGKKTVTVPASGEVPEIVVEMKPLKSPEAAAVEPSKPGTQSTRRLGR